MKSVYIAMSLDGYIADSNESITWLDRFNEQLANSTGYFSKRYAEYYQDVEHVVMGYQTYETIKGFDIEWPYAGKENTVITTKQGVKDDNITQFIDLDTFLNQNHSEKVWIVGGGSIISQMLTQNSVDELIITIMPVMLGNGVPLFHKALNDTMHCTASVVEDGIVELTYTKI